MKIQKTLTDPNSGCPGSLLTTTPSHPVCPWVPGIKEGPPEPKLRGLVLEHYVLEGPAKNISKKVKFD